jgi:GPH family glycoside/pentoside/hexuronide:cation symporter
MLYNPPHAAPEAAAWWFAVGILALTFFWTSVEVPWESLGPEITFNYHERTSILAWRDGMLLAGTVAAIALPPVLSRFFGLSGGEEAERAKFFWFSVLYAPMLVAFCLWCAVAVPERVQEKSSTAVGVLKGLRRLLDNRPFLILLVSYTISSLGSNIPATLILYYVDYVLQSPRAEVFLLLYIATGIAFLPAWVALAKRLEKKTAWLAAMAMNTGAFVGVFFLGAGDEVLYGVLVFLSGIGFGATVALPSSMQADVIDYDELLTGRRREGQYIGIWSVSRKFAAAVGVGIALWVLGAAGYEPNREQSESVVFTLRTLYSLVPSLCNAAAFAIALAYPIDRGMHRRIRECIEAESGGDSCTDPLREGRTPKAGGAWSG